MFLRLLSRRAAPAQRRLVTLAVLCFGVLAVGPASAMAQSQSLSIQSCTFTPGANPYASTCPASSGGFPAGGDPSILTTVNLDTTKGLAGNAVVALQPGVLASASAAPACLSTYSNTDPASCLIGGGTVTVAGSPAPFAAYLSPARTAGDLGGIDLVFPQVPGLLPNGLVIHGEVTLAQSAVDAPVTMDIALPLGSVPSNLAAYTTQMTLFISGTLNNQPFLRMPTNCSPTVPTALTIAYANGSDSTNASPDVAASGCSSLPFKPAITGTATKDSGASNVDVATVVTQNAGEAGIKSLALSAPSSLLSANPNALSALGQQVGTVSAESPLFPVKLTGNVTLEGTFPNLTLQINFPAPTKMSFSGAISLANNSVTFSSVPDLPLTNLTVNLTGGPKSVFTTGCAVSSASLAAAFGSWAGTSVNSSSPLSVSGCSSSSTGTGSTAPVVSGGTLTGLSTGKPAFGFQLASAKNGKKIIAFSVSLPSGLSFVKSGIAKGVSVPGVKIKSEKISGGKLVVTLKSGVSKLKVKISSKALKESAALKAKIKSKKIKQLVAKITTTDAAGKKHTTSLKLKVS